MPRLRLAGSLLGPAAAALLVAAAPALAADALGPHKTDANNPCKVCHDTAAAAPALRGWAGSTTGPTTGWGGKPISALCYMCHTSPNTYGATDQTTNAYSDGNHGYEYTTYPELPEGTADTSIAATGLPYTSGLDAAGETIECTSCHNVHVATSRPFSQRATWQALCDGCHPGRANNAADRVTAGIWRSYSTHPTQQPLGDQGDANLRDEAGLVAAAPLMATAIVVGGAYGLGGHLGLADGVGTTGAMDCTTCHAVHGPAQDSTSSHEDYLAYDNTTPAAPRAPFNLCEGCHFGGDAGEQVGTGYVQSGLGPGSWSDHPIDSLSNRSSLPPGTAIPVSWTLAGSPNRDRGAQAFSAAGSPTCSSCHDVHGGIAGTPLLRGPQPADPWGPFNYDDWCFSCHSTALLLPVAHHSTRLNLSIALGDPIDSQLGCGDCHGPPGANTWSAHSGFWVWPVSISDTDSVFCERCHTPADPTDMVAPALKGQTFSEPAPFPAGHGTARGAASHYLGLDSDEFPGVAPKVAAWSSAYFSSYGAPNSGGGGAVQPVSAGEIICESCHNILWNDGRAHPDVYGTPTAPEKAGWRSNLLLERYEDDPPGTGTGSGPSGVGTALCTGCHAPSGNHHPQTGEVVPLSGQILRTGTGSFADAPGAPGTLSYPALAAMDCDSCHRPHRADDDSDVAAAAHGASTSSDGRATRHILEIDGPQHRYSDLCSECHLH